MRRALALAAVFGLALAALSLAAPALAMQPSVATAIEEKSLLTASGTLVEIRKGRAIDLGVPSEDPDAIVVDWFARRQDGTTAGGVVPGTANRNAKEHLQVAYDEEAIALVVLWQESFSIHRSLQLAVYRNGAWTTSPLLPGGAFSSPRNPQMLLSHPVQSEEDAEGRVTSRTRSLLHVLWWEEGSEGMARYAPAFLDESLDAQELTVYDLPEVAGELTGAPAENAPDGAYLYPSIHAEGRSSAVLASFSDLAHSRHVILRIAMPESLGRTGGAGWQRRRIPIYGVHSSGPMAPGAPNGLAVDTVVGAGYRPTILWRDGGNVRYTRFEGATWSEVKSIPVTETMTESRARALVKEMAARN
ncbi:MAG TPA: hypothetical protein VIE39_10545 [Thermoanaerobaculia bacterium]|jgi:hypothetical protein